MLAAGNDAPCRQLLVEGRLDYPVVVQLTASKQAGAADDLTWEKEGETVVVAGLRGQPFGVAAGGTCKGKREKRGKEGEK